ncbi:hypothetical protein JCM8097_006608 [Rhodosporidiobolus ruineniae]
MPPTRDDLDPYVLMLDGIGTSEHLDRTSGETYKLGREVHALSLGRREDALRTCFLPFATEDQARSAMEKINNRARSEPTSIFLAGFACQASWWFGNTGQTAFNSKKEENRVVYDVAVEAAVAALAPEPAPMDVDEAVDEQPTTADARAPATPAAASGDGAAPFAGTGSGTAPRTPLAPQSRSTTTTPAASGSATEQNGVGGASGRTGGTGGIPPTGPRNSGGAGAAAGAGAGAGSGSGSGSGRGYHPYSAGAGKERLGRKNDSGWGPRGGRGVAGGSGGEGDGRRRSDGPLVGKGWVPVWSYYTVIKPIAGTWSSEAEKQGKHLLARLTALSTPRWCTGDFGGVCVTEEMADLDSKDHYALHFIKIPRKALPLPPDGNDALLVVRVVELLQEDKKGGCVTALTVRPHPGSSSPPTLVDLTVTLDKPRELIFARLPNVYNYVRVRLVEMAVADSEAAAEKEKEKEKAAENGLAR